MWHLIMNIIIIIIGFLDIEHLYVVNGDCKKNCNGYMFASTKSYWSLFNMVKQKFTRFY